MRDWEGKRYWLIGASDGLGRAVALQLSRMGVELVVSARSEDKLDALVLDLPGKATAVPLDVRDPASIDAAHAAAGRIDGLVYLAGAYTPMRAQDWDTKAIETMLDVNLTGAVRCLGAVLPDFLKRDSGHIVLTGSLSSWRGLPGTVGYSTSKTGLAALAETIYGDLRGTGVDVQIVHPGFIRTRLTEQNDFHMPQIMEPEKAAREFVEHMSGDSFSKAYPAPFAWLFRLSPMMPNWLYYRLFR